MAFREISPEEISDNLFTAVNRGWMLITAGDEKDRNTMTASWGSFGTLWGRYVSTVYIRPQRYTYGFVEKNGHYSLCFFDEDYRKALALCGTKSGREIDKEKEAGLSPRFDEAAPYYEEARLVFICKKLYAQDLKEESFTDIETLKTTYPGRDLHKMFIGQIEKVLVRG